MKGFLACVLASVPKFQAAKLNKPIHIAFSYDEEVGCVGVRKAIAGIAEWPVRPLGWAPSMPECPPTAVNPPRPGGSLEENVSTCSLAVRAWGRWQTGQHVR